MASAARHAADAESSFDVPGTNGTLEAWAMSLALSLSPKASMVSGLGPTKATPFSSHNLAKAGRSDRKP